MSLARAVFEYQSLLPPSRTQLEVDVEAAIRESFPLELVDATTGQPLLDANGDPLDVNYVYNAAENRWDIHDADGMRVTNASRSTMLREAMTAELCPVRLLAYLANDRSFELDTSKTTVAEQRALIDASFGIHKNEGTVQSVVNIVTALGFTGVSIEEGLPTHTHWSEFSVILNDDAISVNQGQTIIALIQQYAPLSRQLVQVQFSTAPNTYNGDINWNGLHTFGSVSNIKQ